MANAMSENNIETIANAEKYSHSSHSNHLEQSSATYEVVEAATGKLFDLAREAWQTLSKTSEEFSNRNSQDSTERKSDLELEKLALSLNKSLESLLGENNEFYPYGRSGSLSSSILTESTEHDTRTLKNIQRTSQKNIDANPGEQTALSNSDLQWAMESIDRELKNSPLDASLSKKKGVESKVSTSRLLSRILSDEWCNELIGNLLLEQPSISRADQSPADSRLYSLLNAASSENIAKDQIETEERCDYVTKDFTAEDWMDIRHISLALGENQSDLAAKTLPSLELGSNPAKPEMTGDRLRYSSVGTEAESTEIIADRESIEARSGDILLKRNQRTGIATLERNGVRILESDNSGGKLVSTSSGKLLYLKDGKISLLDKDRNIIGNIDNKEIEFQFSNSNVIVRPEADSLDTAIASALRSGMQIDEFQPVIVKFKDGLALMDIKSDAYLIFKNTERGLEAHAKLSENQTLIRGADNKLRIHEADGKVTVLSPEQVSSLVQKFSTAPGTMGNLVGQILKGSHLRTSNGAAVDWADGVLRYSDVESPHASRPALASLTWHEDELKLSTSSIESGSPHQEATEIELNFSDKKLRLSSITGDKSDNDTIIDLSGKEPCIENNDIIIKNGKAEIKGSKVSVDRENNITLADGSRILASGDISFADGSFYRHSDHYLESSKQYGSRPTDSAPSEKHVDNLVLHAMSLARSIASRASGGNISYSELTLLKANISIVANLIGLFSTLGEMGAATELYGSWNLMTNSLYQAGNEARNST